MKVSLRTGKPAEPSMLVNVPKLITTYYTGAPDPAVRRQPPRSKKICCLPQEVRVKDLADEKIQIVLTQVTGERRCHRQAEGDCPERMFRNAPISERERVQDLCG